MILGVAALVPHAYDAPGAPTFALPGWLNALVGTQSSIPGISTGDGDTTSPLNGPGSLRVTLGRPDALEIAAQAANYGQDVSDEAAGFAPFSVVEAKTGQLSQSADQTLRNGDQRRVARIKEAVDRALAMTPLDEHYELLRPEQSEPDIDAIDARPEALRALNLGAQ